MRDFPLQARAVILGTSVLGLVLWLGAAATLSLPSVHDLTSAVLFFLAALALEFVAIPLRSGGALALSTIPHVAGVLVLPLSAVITLGGLATLIEQVARRVPWYKAAFNTGSTVLSIASAGLAARVLGNPLDLVSTAPLLSLVSLLLISLTYYVVTANLLAFLLSRLSGQRFRAVISQDMSASGAAEISTAVTGGLLGFIWTISPWWTLAMLFPTVMAYQALRYSYRMAHEVAARRKAEEAQRLLAGISALLAAAMEAEQALPEVARALVPALADWCAVDVVEEAGTCQRAASAWQPSVSGAQAEALARLLSPEGDSVIALARRSSTAVLYESLVPATPAATQDGPSQLEALRALGVQSLLVAPLVAHNKALGILTCARVAGARCYEASDLALAEDVARRIALAVEYARLYRQAQAAISARDEFLSIASHELKTPITALRAYAEVVARQLDRGDVVDRVRARRALQVIDQQSERVARLVSRLLDVARIETGQLHLEPAPTDVAALVLAVVESTQARTSQHRLSARTPDHVLALVDPLRLEQVLANLLDNAIKFSPGGGEIAVELSAPGPDTLCLRVRDHGVGIPPEHRAHLFDRFSQAHTRGHLSGMGLGLFISREIVELHGGTIEAEFPPDGGTCFVVTLPARQAASATQAVC